MNDLRQLLYNEQRKNKQVNWVRFLRSNLAAFMQAPVKQREDFIREFIQDIDCFSLMAQKCEVSNDFVRQFLDLWKDNDLFYSIKPQNYNEFVSYIQRDWAGMSFFVTGDMDQKIIERFKQCIDWKYCLQNRHFSGEFIQRNIDYFKWLNKHQKLQLWKTLSYFQPNLTDSFIQKYQKKLDWPLMSSNQNFSETIMLKFMDKIDWTSVLENKNTYLSFSVERKLREKEIL